MLTSCLKRGPGGQCGGVEGADHGSGEGGEEEKAGDVGQGEEVVEAGMWWASVCDELKQFFWCVE